MATSPSVCAGTLDSAPLNEPTGVRAALTMTTSSSFILASNYPNISKVIP
jgi:predicted secreted protein